MGREKKAVTFRYNSNVKNSGTVKILIPWLSGKSASRENFKNFDVRKDGKKTPFQIALLNRDAFIIVETDFRDHVLEIR
ncbi:MAG: hypothetical protein MUP52_06210 [Candidatus Aminicenantes bacterium]|nr:hypothetical protein [Candidatus Aminicenantes bacterium]